MGRRNGLGLGWLISFVVGFLVLDWLDDDGYLKGRAKKRDAQKEPA